VAVSGAVRHLFQPDILKSAALAALATSLACCPRLVLWTDRRYPLWYLESVIFLCAIVLWAFVFAWHTRHAQRPVFTLKIEGAPFAAATLAGILGAAALYLFLDPALRRTNPEEYPADLEHWLAITLFIVGFAQLVLVFAPFAFFARLFHSRRAAMVLTVLFGVFVLALKAGASPKLFPLPLLAALLLVRIVAGILDVIFYLRGGVVLVWWLVFLIEARHLLYLGAAPEP
jgi:hypothetical protein